MKQNILIVDDNPHVVNDIINILYENNKNYYFYPAKNGKIAYELAISKLPDLIITDWDMPIMNGLELLKKLKQNQTTIDIPVIMATAVMLTSQDLKDSLEAGAIDYIQKPVEVIELIARTQSVLKISAYNKQLIENKNRELAENALLLIRNNKFNIAVTKQLQKLRNKITDEDEEIDEIFNQIIIEIDEKIKQDSWQRFELSFKSINADYKKNLLEKFPKLTTSELKLCIFLRIGMNSKDIAAVMYQSNGSIKVARSRLRKKLQLAHNQNLQLFLSSF